MPVELWKRISCSAAQRRLQRAERLLDGRLAIFEWPTRHTKLLFLGSANQAKHRLTLVDHAGDLPCSEEERFSIQAELVDWLKQLFPDLILNIRIQVASASLSQP